jgi:hypothetical protein
MGRFHEDGYSADVEAFFVVSDRKLRLAKTNGCTFVFSTGCNLSPGTTGRLVVTIDGEDHSKTVVLPDGSEECQPIVRYEVLAPF